MRERTKPSFYHNRFVTSNSKDNGTPGKSLSTPFDVPMNLRATWLSDLFTHISSTNDDHITSDMTSYDANRSETQIRQLLLFNEQSWWSVGETWLRLDVWCQSDLYANASWCKMGEHCRTSEISGATDVMRCTRHMQTKVTYADKASKWRTNLQLLYDWLESLWLHPLTWRRTMSWTDSYNRSRCFDFLPLIRNGADRRTTEGRRGQRTPPW